MLIQNLFKSAVALTANNALLVQSSPTAPRLDRFEKKAASDIPTRVMARTPDAARALPARPSTSTYFFKQNVVMEVPPCYPPTGELVNMTIVDSGVEVTTNSSGVVTFDDHTQEFGRGVGQTSGKTYLLISVNTDKGTYTIDPPYQGSVRTVNDYKLIEQGEGTVYNYHGNVAYTYNATGLYYTIDDIQGGCP